MNYKKDVIIGTWIAVYAFLGVGFAALVTFEQMVIPPEIVKECHVCRWTNP